MMTQKFTILGVVGVLVLAVALSFSACSNGGSSGPTAPPDPVAIPTSTSAAGGLGSGEIELIQGPGVFLEKATNGFDADTAPGPSVAVGSLVEWTYVVTNIGDVPLVSFVVDDDQEGEICRDTNLASGASFTCTKQARAIDGQYANEGRVRASDGSDRVEATDPSHYLGGGGAFSAIEIEKTTQVSRDSPPEDADYPTGPTVLTGDPVRWDYTITNIGEVALEAWQITDDQIGEICTGDSLAVGATESCFTSRPARPGQYANVGLVEAFDGTRRISDDDPSHYFGSDPSVSLDKLTDGADGSELIIGCPVTWTYEVTNTGNIDLEEIAVEDDQLGAVSCPASVLASGDSFTCEAGGFVQAGNYSNIGSVTAHDPIDTLVEASDGSSYVGTDQCANVVPSEDSLWPPNHRLVTVELMGNVCNGDATSFTITSITQDEPVNGLGDGDTSPDGVIVGDGTVQLRRERAGGGNGRVYEVTYEALNGSGVGCSGSVTVSVPHDQGGAPAIDDGQNYDSTVE